MSDNADLAGLQQQILEILSEVSAVPVGEIKLDDALGPVDGPIDDHVWVRYGCDTPWGLSDPLIPRHVCT